MVGIPGSGKSTWIKGKTRDLEEDGFRSAIVSRDYIRKSLIGKDEYFSHEKEVFNEFVREANECMKLGFDAVFIDATHINPSSRAKILKRLRPDPSTVLKIMVFNTPIEVCIERNEKRSGFEYVPIGAIERMAKDFRAPTEEEFPSDLYGFKNINVTHIF